MKIIIIALAALFLNVSSGWCNNLTNQRWWNDNPSWFDFKVELSKNQNINAQNEAGTTPLMFASASGHKYVVKWMLQNGADIEIKDKDGKTALFYAVNAGDEEIVKVLLSYNAEVNVRTSSEDLTALMLAA